MAIEPIREYIKRRLTEVGTAQFQAVASDSGVNVNFIRKFFYGCRENPRIQSIEPLLNYFEAIDRGERELAPCRTTESIHG